MLKFLLACLGLTVLMNLRYPAPLPHPLAVFVPPPELIVIIGLMATAASRRIPVRRPVFLILTLGTVVLCLLRLGESTARTYLNRSFNLYMDTGYLPDLLHLLYTTVSGPVFMGGILGGLLLLVCVFKGIRQSFRTINHFLQSERHRRYVWKGGAALLAGYLILLTLLPADARLKFRPDSMLPRLFKELWFVVNIDSQRKKFMAQLRPQQGVARQIKGSLDKLNGDDVYLFFIESYGHTVFAHERHRALMRPVLNRFEKHLVSKGYAIYSNFLNSPAYGGASWLAHATLASGYHLNNQMRYNMLISSDSKTAAHAFERAGYKTVSVMPGITWPWPEDKFFGFQKEYYARHFDYQGPPFGWSPMPDQYVLDFVYRREMVNPQQPLYIEFVLISSHAPFHEQPPYLDDWSEIGSGAVYTEKDKITYPVQWPELADAEEAYAAALTYEFNILQDFAENRIKSDALILIMGDHQPNLKITGPNQPWSVPVHILSRNSEIVKPFAARGYIPGMIPNQQTPHTDMASVMAALFEDFSTPVTAGIE